MKEESVSEILERIRQRTEAEQRVFHQVTAMGASASPFAFAFHADQDGDMWMHSDDPISADCEVAVVRHTQQGKTEVRVMKGGDKGAAYFPALKGQIPAYAWFTDRDFCRLHITAPDGTVTTYGECDHEAAD